MDGFDGCAESLAAARAGDEVNGGGCAWEVLRLQERENNLRTREEKLVKWENDLQEKDELLARGERLVKELQEDLAARKEAHARERDEVLRELYSMWRRAEEDSDKYRQDAYKVRKQLEDELDSVEELQCRVQARGEALRIREKEAELKLKAREEALRIREKEADLKKKNVNTWSMGQIISMLVLVIGLMLFIQIRTVFPLEYLNHVVGGFAIFWVLNTMFLCGVFRTFSTTKNFSRHIEWPIYMCFLAFIIYALYLIALPVDGTSPGASLSSASMSTTPTDGRSILFEIIAVVQNTLSWDLAYASGKRDPNAL